MATAKKPAAKPAAKKPAAKKVAVKPTPTDVPAVNPAETVALSTQADADGGIGPFDHYREIATVYGVFGVPAFHVMTFEEFEKNGEIGHKPVFTDAR